jgi:hypothetical protein
MWGLSPGFSGSHRYIWNVFSRGARAGAAAVAAHLDKVFARRVIVDAGRNDAILDTH